MRFIVEGANALSGRDVRVVFEAQSAVEAERRANANHVYVASVRPEAPVAVLPYESGVEQMRLFRTTAVGLATFLGTPLAGGAVLAMNFARLGRSGAAAMSVVLGAALTGLQITAALLAPPHTPGALFWFPMLLAMQFLAKKLQGEQVEQHIRRGGALVNNWAAAGIGLAGLVLAVGLCLAVVMVR